MADKVFADGFNFKEAPEKAPAWIKGQIAVRVDKAVPFLEKYKNERGWVNLSVKEGKTGSIYIELDTWAPDKKQESAKPEDEVGF